MLINLSKETKHLISYLDNIYDMNAVREQGLRQEPCMYDNLIKCKVVALLDCIIRILSKFLSLPFSSASAIVELVMSGK